MKSAIVAVALAMSFVGPAVASPDCSGMTPQTPMWKVMKNFEDSGGTVRTAKLTDDKCYEIYGSDRGKRVEIYYSPETGEVLERDDD